MTNEIKEYLDSANFKFKDIDENGNEKEMTLSETFEFLIKNNKELENLITNLRYELEEKEYEIKDLKKQLDAKKEECNSLIEEINPYERYGISEKNFH